MMIAVTGTPGTGKTMVSERLEDEGYSVVHLTDYFEQKDIGEEVNGEREIRIGEMKHSLEEEGFDEKTVIEGHLAHHFPVDICVVLRCRPDELEERLSGRNYSDRKVEENVEAEKLDIILSEAVQNQETVLELDTTGQTVEETSGRIIEKVEKGESGYGDIDWTEYL